MQGWGLTEERLPALATPFGGGSGGTHRLTCGALSGALLALGVAHAAGLLLLEASYEIGAELVHDFRRALGSAVCCEMIDLDPEDPDWRENYHAHDARATACQPAVDVAVRRAWELLEEGGGHG